MINPEPFLRYNVRVGNEQCVCKRKQNRQLAGEFASACGHRAKPANEEAGASECALRMHIANEEAGASECALRMHIANEEAGASECALRMRIHR